jgi:hypothetical protein
MVSQVQQILAVVVVVQHSQTLNHMAQAVLADLD